ncbi:MAG: hypothetical protein QOJ29_4485 [Thermoleophilaceae bacterium]|nr:hypothetical protein [Thermoleophilaceae bacterium]
MTRLLLLAVLAACGFASNALAAGILTPADAGPFRGIGCSGTTCLLTTNSVSKGGGAVVALNDGAAGAAQPVTDAIDLFGADCASASTCFAVGTNGAEGVLVPVINGSAQPLIIVGTVTSLQAIGCASATRCFAGGQSKEDGSDDPVGAIVPVSDTQPGVAQVVPDTSSIVDMSCPSASSCTAVGEAPSGAPNGIVQINSGSVGAFKPLPETANGAAGIDAIACAAVERCVGVTADAALTLIDGKPGDWTKISDTSVGDIACPTTSTCIGVADGDFPTMIPIAGDGRSSAPRNVPGMAGTSAIDCDSSTHCYAVGTNGNGGGGGIAPIAVPDLTFPAPLKFPDGCVVPRVVGLSVPAAKKKLAKANCRAGKIRFVVSKRFRKRVIQQRPSKGRLRRNAKVGLTVGR